MDEGNRARRSLRATDQAARLAPARDTQPAPDAEASSAPDTEPDPTPIQRHGPERPVRLHPALSFRSPPADPAVRLTPADQPDNPAGRLARPGFRSPPADPAVRPVRPVPPGVPRPPTRPVPHPSPVPPADAAPAIIQRPPLDPELPPAAAAARELPLAAAASQEPPTVVLKPPRAPVPEPPRAPVPEPPPAPVARQELPPTAAAVDQGAAAGISGGGGSLPRLSGRRVRIGVPWSGGRAAAAVILVLAAAGSVTVALALPHAGGNSGGRASSASPAGGGQKGITEPAAVQQAAEWVSQQVSRSAIVACDPLTCSALQARGVPAANLLVLGNAAVDPLHAEVVVATPAVRRQFGGRLGSVYAPSVIAAFGSGPSRVNVMVTAPNGAPAYVAALRRDLAARKAVGAQLLSNRGITVTAQARAQLASGQVDSRLLIVLPALAAVHPVKILGFGDPGPGASPGIPLCSADLSGSGHAAGMTDASYLRWLVGFMRAQLLPFSGSTAVVWHDGRAVVRVIFSRPSPLGLLTQG